MMTKFYLSIINYSVLSTRFARITRRYEYYLICLGLFTNINNNCTVFVNNMPNLGITHKLKLRYFALYLNEYQLHFYMKYYNLSNIYKLVC